jgi:Neurotransmitter-gated ion-channel ligand binding domain
MDVLSYNKQLFLSFRLIGIQLCILMMISGISKSNAFAEQWTEDGNRSPVGITTDTILEQSTEKAVEKAAEKTAEKTAEKVVEAEGKKAVLKATRPDEWLTATTVYFSVFVLDIDGIDAAAQNFTTNVFIRLRWKDLRLAKQDGATRQIPLDEVWNPHILIANGQGIISKSLPDVVEVDPDGMVYYRQRYTGKMSQALRLTEFPMDKHTFTIHFISTGYTEEEVEFKPDTIRNIVGGSMAKDLSLPDWEIVHYQAPSLMYMPIEQLRVPGFAFQFEARRYFMYYIWQVVLPLGVVIVMSWAGFFIARVHVSVRIAVATSAILTLITLRFVFSNLLPRLPYMTRMDYFTVGSTVCVFLALISVVLTSYFEGIQKELIAKRLDRCSQFIFPSAFICLLVWFLSK